MANENTNAKQDGQELNSEQMEGVAGGYFRPAPAGDGTTEQFFTVKIDEGRVASIQPVSPDVIASAS